MTIIQRPNPAAEFYTAYMPPPTLPGAYRCRAWRTYDDVTGRLSLVEWDIQSTGTLVLILTLANGNIHAFLMRASGSFPIGGNVQLVKGKTDADGIISWEWPSGRGGNPLGFTIGFFDGPPLTQEQIDAIVPAGATIHTG